MEDRTLAHPLHDVGNHGRCLLLARRGGPARLMHSRSTSCDSTSAATSVGAAPATRRSRAGTGSSSSTTRASRRSTPTDAVTELCPIVGRDAVVACSYARKLFARRGVLPGAARLAPQHPGRVFDVASPAEGCVVGHTGDDLVLWHLQRKTGRPPCPCGRCLPEA